MSNLKDLFNDIKDVFKQEGVEVETPETPEVETPETPENVAEKFEDVVLADGTLAQVEPEIIIGAAVVVQSDDELIPAPDGEHELADGRRIVTEGGVIVEVIEGGEEIEAPEGGEDVAEELDNETGLSEEQKKDAKKIIESIITEKHFSTENIIVTLQSNIDKAREEIEKLTGAYNKVVELLEFLIEEPKTETVKKNKSGFSRTKTKTRDVLKHIRETKKNNLKK